MKIAIAICLVAACVAGCLTPEPNGSTPERNQQHQTSLSDTSQVKVVVCEFLITNTLKNTTGLPLFVKLDRTERECLRRLLPSREIKAASGAYFAPGLGVCEKMSKRPGILVGATIHSVDGPTAIAHGACSRTSPVWFTFKLRKSPLWAIEQVAKEKIYW
jgi:hypothetical protein